VSLPSLNLQKLRQDPKEGTAQQNCLVTSSRKKRKVIRLKDFQGEPEQDVPDEYEPQGKKPVSLKSKVKTIAKIANLKNHFAP